jgi:hypothetical protein
MIALKSMYLIKEKLVLTTRKELYLHHKKGMFQKYIEQSQSKFDLAQTSKLGHNVTKRAKIMTNIDINEEVGNVSSTCNGITRIVLVIFSL